MSPIVAIVGSANPNRDYVSPLPDPLAASEAAQAIGHELAVQSCSVVVFSSDPQYIEQSVITGYLSSGKARPRSVLVASRYGSDTHFAEIHNHPEVFVVRPESTDDWEVAFYRALLEVDAVLLIGGGRSTFVAGVIALARRVAVAPVASFGGAAERVWHRLNNNRGPATEEEVTALASPWRPEMAAAIVRSLVAQHERDASKIAWHQRECASIRRRTAAGMFSAMLLLFMSLLAIPVAYAVPVGAWQNVAVLVAGPLLASTCGAMIRNAYDRTTEWLRATVLGAAAGAIAFLLFVAAQLTTNPDMLAAGGARRLVFFVLAIGFVGGFTSETVYHKLRDRDVTTTAALPIESR